MAPKNAFIACLLLLSHILALELKECPNAQNSIPLNQILLNEDSVKLVLPAVSETLLDLQKLHITILYDGSNTSSPIVVCSNGTTASCNTLLVERSWEIELNDTLINKANGFATKDISALILDSSDNIMACWMLQINNQYPIYKTFVLLLVPLLAVSAWIVSMLSNVNSTKENFASIILSSFFLITFTKKKEFSIVKVISKRRNSPPKYSITYYSPSFVDVVYTAQFICFCGMLKLLYPSPSLISFTSLFAWSNFIVPIPFISHSIGNFTGKDVFSNELIYQTIHEGLDVFGNLLGIESRNLFMIVLLNFLIVLAIGFTGIGILYSSVKLFKSHVNNFWKAFLAFSLRTFNIAYPILLITAIQLLSSGYFGKPIYFGLAILTLFLCLIIFFVLHFLNTKKTKSTSALAVLSNSHSSRPYFFIVGSAYRILMAVVIGLTVLAPSIQICLFVGTNLVYFLSVLVIRPMNEVSSQVIAFISSALLLLSVVLHGIFTDELNAILGYTFIVIQSLNICLIFLFATWNLFTHYIYAVNIDDDDSVIDDDGNECSFVTTSNAPSSIEIFNTSSQIDLKPGYVKGIMGKFTKKNVPRMVIEENSDPQLLEQEYHIKEGSVSSHSSGRGYCESPDSTRVDYHLMYSGPSLEMKGRLSARNIV